MKNFNKNKKNGFSILAIILVIVVIIVAIGIWALSGQSNTSNSGETNAKVMASSITNDASSIKLSFDKLVIGGTSKEAVTYSLDGNLNSMLNSSAQGADQINPPAGAVYKNATEPDGVYVYIKEFYNNVTAPVKHKAIVLTGVTTVVCQQLNQSINGTTAIPTYISITNANQVVAGATKADPNTATKIDFKVNGMSDGDISFGWTSGCFSATNKVDQNVFFRILD